jgi:hypothetical protein
LHEDGFGILEELSENRLPPGAVVAPRTLEEAEVVTYVLSGALAQEDSAGRSRVVQAGEFQRMITGRQVHTSERNASQLDWAHIFRLYLHPATSGLDGSPAQKLFSVAERRGALCVVASPDGRSGSLRIHPDVRICSAILDPGQHLVHELAPGRRAWLHVVRGEVTIGDLVLATGDGVGVDVTAEPSVSFTAREESEILLVDLGAPPPEPPSSRLPAQ